MSFVASKIILYMFLIFRILILLYLKTFFDGLLVLLTKKHPAHNIFAGDIIMQWGLIIFLIIVRCSLVSIFWWRIIKSLVHNWVFIKLLSQANSYQYMLLSLVSIRSGGTFSNDLVVLTNSNPSIFLLFLWHASDLLITLLMTSLIFHLDKNFRTLVHFQHIHEFPFLYLIFRIFLCVYPFIIFIRRYIIYLVHLEP